MSKTSNGYFITCREEKVNILKRKNGTKNLLAAKKKKQIKKSW